jgi:tetratricopeptide (TPR) repeat protein
MAGVFTDNQPDFSFLAPYETKTFSQFWWPIQDIGLVQQATTRAALAMTVDEKTSAIHLGLCVSETVKKGSLCIYEIEDLIAEFSVSLKPGECWKNDELIFEGHLPSDLTAVFYDQNEEEILHYSPIDTSSLTQDREKATEPTPPEDMDSVEELFLTGEHLEQYRHPTRNPEDYWNEALRRDPAHTSSHIALGKRAFNRGMLDTAENHFRQAIARLTHRHPNPSDGEAFYYLGLTLHKQGNLLEAYNHYYKATWNYAWRAAAFYQLACIDICREKEITSLEHIEQSLISNNDNNKAHVLKAILLKRLGKNKKAKKTLNKLLKIDPLDHWARCEKCLLTDDNDALERWLIVSRNDAQTILDISFDYLEAGCFEEAHEILSHHHNSSITPVAVPNPLERSPMTHYLLAKIYALTLPNDAEDALDRAIAQSADYFFPSRLDEMLILEWVLRQDFDTSNAAYALGNYYFDKKRHADAIRVWEQAVAANTTIPQVYRNLGIAYWNNGYQGEKAAAMYAKAIELDPTDARFISEFDQLSKKRNLPLEDRLAFLESRRDLVEQRDDATVALAELYNQTGEPQKALDLILSRKFHPWEGGEGAVLRQYTNAHLQLGQLALEASDPQSALDHFTAAMVTPESLGEAYHPLQAKADVNYWMGKAYQALGETEKATDHFRLSAEESGDFSAMAATAHSPLSYYRGLSLRELGDESAATALFEDLLAFGKNGLKTKASIDYFATSLPNLLVFDEDLQACQNAEYQHLIDLAKKEL